MPAWTQRSEFLRWPDGSPTGLRRVLAAAGRVSAGGGVAAGGVAVVATGVAAGWAGWAVVERGTPGKAKLKVGLGSLRGLLVPLRLGLDMMPSMKEV